MTSTKNGAATDPLRHFPTPEWAIGVVLPDLPLSGIIVDPGCGAGAILKRVSQGATRQSLIIGVEYQERLYEEARQFTLNRPAVHVVHDDFLRPTKPWDPVVQLYGDLENERMPLGLPYANLVISNPPFKLALEFVIRGLKLTAPVNGTVAMLLRNDWVAPRERTAFVKAHPCDKRILNRRPQFRALINGKRGSDSCDYAWHLWGPGRGGRWGILDCPKPVRRPRKKKGD